jgi:hypothetical protein
MCIFKLPMCFNFYAILPLHHPSYCYYNILTTFIQLTLLPHKILTLYKWRFHLCWLHNYKKWQQVVMQVNVKGGHEEGKVLALNGPRKSVMTTLHLNCLWWWLISTSKLIVWDSKGNNLFGFYVVKLDHCCVSDFHLVEIGEASYNKVLKIFVINNTIASFAKVFNYWSFVG